MASLRIVIAAVATAGAPAVAGVLVLRSGDEAEPARERLVVAAASAGPSMLVDARGAILEEFTGDCAGRRHAYLCESVTMAKRLGLVRADGPPILEFSTFALGINEVDPIAVAGTYATYAGYTPDLASAVSLGHPGNIHANKLSDVTIGGKRYEHVRGTTIPGPIWKDSMRAALDGTEGTSFTPPDTTRFGGCSHACAN